MADIDIEKVMRIRKLSVGEIKSPRNRKKVR